eukprot:TRINITY_DN6642_c0_g1_i7.p1 TRINITY_DN6642_c0_g1~~TRINITY_DN6642_c0_g1_i7.p1  ORF type:complete len:159 (+),score=39.48 TRINITY_DN6642_c0_g1_i7:131-607(+)
MCIRDRYRTRRTNKNIVPVEGDYLHSNNGNRMLLVVEDTFREQNKFTNKSFKYRPYTESDAEEAHQECSESLQEQLMEQGLCPPMIPLPWPLFCDVKNSSGLEYTCRPSNAPAGQSIKMKALMNVVLVVSSCCMETNEECAHESNIDISSSLKHWPGV